MAKDHSPKDKPPMATRFIRLEVPKRLESPAAEPAATPVLQPSVPPPTSRPPPAPEVPTEQVFSAPHHAPQTTVLRLAEARGHAWRFVALAVVMAGLLAALLWVLVGGPG